ncbi:MAG: hypothetical protein WDO17_10450 [Alphaproteobacteria bacterium]
MTSPLDPESLILEALKLNVRHALELERQRFNVLAIFGIFAFGLGWCAMFAGPVIFHFLGAALGLVLTAICWAITASLTERAIQYMKFAIYCADQIPVDRSSRLSDFFGAALPRAPLFRNTHLGHVFHALYAVAAAYWLLLLGYNAFLLIMPLPVL